MLPFSRNQLGAALGGICLLLAVMGVGTALRRRLPPPAAPPLPAINAPFVASGVATAGGPTTNAPAGAPAIRAQASTRIVVHVTGCVRCPGVYTFAEGARVCDAVKRAGGAKPNADLEMINLAARLEDGKQLYVPRKQAAQPPRAVSRPSRRRQSASFWTPPAEIRLEPIPPGRMPLARPQAKDPQAGGKPEGAQGTTERPDEIRSPADGRVNINRADAQELQRLPYIGPAMAQRILEYRKENGPFQSVEQLLEVRGIGPKRLAQLRDLVEL